VVPGHGEPGRRSAAYRWWPATRNWNVAMSHGRSAKIEQSSNGMCERKEGKWLINPI
jgi:hypothetical protein